LEKARPAATQYQALLADAVKADTRKLSSFGAFQQAWRRLPSEGVRARAA